jgi:hypothetical protein
MAFPKAYILSIKDDCVIRPELYCILQILMWIKQSHVWSDNLLLPYANTVIHIFGPRGIHDRIFLR